MAMVMNSSDPPAEAAIPEAGWLTTSGSRIVDSAGAAYTIKATNWFGMETSDCAPHGLWQISLDSGLAQIASFGFNTIRLPFSNECLVASATTSIDHTLNPELAGKTPLEVMDVVLARADAHGLKVILDRHRPDSAAQSPLWYTSTVSEQRWIDDWLMLAQRYRDDATVIGVDLHNEPRGTACWGCGTASRDWAGAATRAGDAILAVNPKLLIIVQGVENQANGGGTWWGGGLADVAAHPIELAVANQLVYSPHDYPASVAPQSWFTATDYPANLPTVWSANWGYLQQQGIAPVLLGEFGTKLATRSDQQWLAALVSYLKTNEMSFSYWSFNPNSVDTGGLVGDDWSTPQQAKLTALRPILDPPEVAPVRSSSPSTTPTASTSPTPTTSPAAGPIKADWHLNSSWETGYVAEIQVTADTAHSGWAVRWSDPAATSVANAWGMTCSVQSGSIVCVGADWARNLVAGQTVTVGLQVDSPGPAPSQPSLTLG